MTIFLAQAGGVALTLRDIMDGALVAATVAATVVAIIVAQRKSERVKISPQPLRTKMEGDVDVRIKGRRFSGELCDERHESLDAQIDALESADARLAGEIAAVKTGIGHMEQRLNAADEDRTRQIHLRLNDMPSQIVAQLLNSKRLFAKDETH